MLFDANNPRSLFHQVERIKYYVESLSDLQKMQANITPEHEKIAFELYAHFKLGNVLELAIVDEGSMIYKKLDDFLSEVYGLLNKLITVVTKTYFKHLQAAQMVVK